MGKKDKKKGKGAEKTAAKTAKNADIKLKKELKSKGEEDIENLIAKVQEEDKRRQAVTEEITDPPSLRAYFTLTAHPDKEELILFGGEFFVGNKTSLYNDLYFYNIKKNEWTLVKAPDAAPPRSAHQAVAVSQGGGQLWIFGGEFTSPTQSQFHHYKDLWVFHLQPKRWEKIRVAGGPSARSGHRMVASKKHLFVFGGFHDNLRDYKYFNDMYAFSLETYKWQKLDPVGIAPAPRSACQMAALPDGRLLVYGGYSKEALKKDVDKSVIHTDMFLLQPNKMDETSSKWKWTQVRQVGCKPSMRCSFSMAFIGNNRAVIFGGVHNELENDEELEGTFFNDLYQLELEHGRWHQVRLNEPRAAKGERKRRRKDRDVDEEWTLVGKGNSAVKMDEADADSSDYSEEEATDKLAGVSIQEDAPTDESAVTTHDDGVFTVTIGPQRSQGAAYDGESEMIVDDSGTSSSTKVTNAFWPRSRMSAGLVVKHGILYLYGGIYEDGDKQITLPDFYALDLHKLDEWKTIIALKSEQQDWMESDSSDSDEDDDDEEMVEGACGVQEESI